MLRRTRLTERRARDDDGARAAIGACIQARRDLRLAARRSGDKQPLDSLTVLGLNDDPHFDWGLRLGTSVCRSTPTSARYRPVELLLDRDHPERPAPVQGAQVLTHQRFRGIFAALLLSFNACSHHAGDVTSVPSRLRSEHSNGHKSTTVPAMKAQANGSMQYVSWDEQVYSQVEGGPKLTNSSIVHKLTGDIEGEGKLDYVMLYLDERNTTFLGYEQVTAKLGERSGTFVLRHEGKLEGGAAKVALEVVAGSGTGDFRGMRGSGIFEAKDATSSLFRLDYSFE
jgi:hypothetical protein